MENVKIINRKTKAGSILYPFCGKCHVVKCVRMCLRVVKCNDGKQGDAAKTGVLKLYAYLLQTRTAAGVRDVQSVVKCLTFIEQHYYLQAHLYVSSSFDLRVMNWVVN